MDDQVLEFLFKITLLLLVPLALIPFRKQVAAAVRVYLSFLTICGCFVVTVTMLVLPEEVGPVIALPEVVGQTMATVDSFPVTVLNSDSVPGTGFIDYWTILWSLSACVWVVWLWRMIAARVELARLKPTTNSASHADLAWALAQASTTRKVRLVDQELSSSTFLYGWIRPTIALPQGFPSWPCEKRRAALLHEAMHMVCWDYLILSVARVITVGFWWHPLAWVVGRELRGDVERACDDRVLAVDCDIDLSPFRYATYLLEIAGNVENSRKSLPGISMAASTSLRSRINAIVDPQQRRTSMPVKSANIVSGISAMVIAVLFGSSSVVSADGGPDRRYMPVYKTVPIYPDEAEEQRLEGWVVLEFEVTPGGTTQNVEVVDRSDESGIFDQAAIDAVAKFRYLPERVDGTPVAVIGVRNKVTFELAEDANVQAGTGDLERTLKAATRRNSEIRREIETAAWEAEGAGDGDRLLDLARFSLEHYPSLTTHLLLRARAIGVSDSSSLQLVTGMNFFKLGDLDAAQKAFSQLARSEGNQSQLGQRWQTYIERESQRRAVVHEALAGGAG